MRRPLWAVLVLCACVLRVPAAVAVTITSPQTAVRTGVTGPTVVAPLNTGGPTLQNILGPVDIKGTLSDLPGVPSVLGRSPAAVKPGLTESAPDIFSAMGLPVMKMGFRPDIAPPALPGSAIPGAAAAQAAYGTINPAAPAAFAVETMAEAGLTRGQSARMDLPDGSLKPGPGGGLTVLSRQSLRLAAKTEAVKAQLSAAAESGAAATEEGAQSLGVRLMNILTDERTLGGSGKAKTPALGLQPGLSGLRTASAHAGAHSLSPQSMAGGSAVSGASAWSYNVPAGNGGYWLAYRQPADSGSGVSESGHSAGGVALIALQVSRQSLILSVVDAPARSLALRWAEDSAWALAERADSGAIAMAAAPAAELRDAVASPSAAAPVVVVPLGPQVQSAQTEVFSFLQSAGGSPAAADGTGAPARSGLRPGASAPWGAPAPVSFPDPLLAASLLPFIGLLILRSRLFS